MRKVDQRRTDTADAKKKMVEKGKRNSLKCFSRQKYHYVFCLSHFATTKYHTLCNEHFLSHAAAAAAAAAALL